MHLKQGTLIALMALGSVSMWVLNPLLWLWITSRLQSSAGQAQMGPYVLLLVGVLLTAVGLAKGLAALNRRYGRSSCRGGAACATPATAGVRTRAAPRSACSTS